MDATKVVIVLVALSSICAVSVAQSSGISSSCTSVLVTLSPCLNYITGNSSAPSSSCCTQLDSVVKSSPECLCEVINSGGGSMASSLNINQTQALGLPNVCDIKTPPVSSCNKASPPSGSPAETTPTTTTTTPSSSTSGLGGGSKATPTTQVESSEASLSKLPQITLIFAILFITSHVLPFNTV